MNLKDLPIEEIKSRGEQLRLCGKFIEEIGTDMRDAKKTPIVSRMRLHSVMREIKDIFEAPNGAA